MGLDVALTGSGLQSKTHHVKLNSGEEISDMSGAKAPEMWREHQEYSAVMEYLRGDVVQPIKLAEKIVENHGIKWFSKSGKFMSQRCEMTPVKDLFSLPLPDTSWMANPPKRRDIVSWIPQEILNKYNIDMYLL